MPDESQGRWSRIEALFAAALAQPPESRATFVDSATRGDDPTIRSEVLALLQAHDQTGVVDRLQNDVSALTASLRPRTLEEKVIGHYRVEARVGGGGMGVVYRARDLRLGRPVALKFLAGHLDTDPVAAERFRNEARTIAALEHPNICTLHEFGETEDGLPYLVLPLYEGITVQDRLEDARMPVEEAVGITIQVLRGLGKAHAHGIIHRDIKPSNVLVTTDGVIKLLDFGVAKLANMTITGIGSAPVGTLAYMSPEQALGEPLDLRTDIWSTGVMLYEMLGGERPYSSGIAAALTGKEGFEPLRPLHSLNEKVSPALEAIVTKALERDPAARYQSAADFERALQNLGIATINDGHRLSALGRRTGCGRRIAEASAIAALILIAGGIWYATSHAQAPAADAKVENRLSIAVPAWADTIAPDQRALSMMFFKLDPAFKPIRGHPAFLPLLARPTPQ